MSQDALGQLKHLKTARARWPFPDVGGQNDGQSKVVGMSIGFGKW